MNEFIVWVDESGFFYREHEAAMEAYKNWTDRGYEVILQVIYEEEH